MYNMDSEKGGQTPNERQRQTASEIARRRVLAAYEKTESSSPVSKTTAPRISNEEWKKYHSAWQNYYQKYYSEYYSNAARQYVAKEKLKAERRQSEQAEALKEISTKAVHDSKDPAVATTLLRERIREKASDSAIKIRHRKKIAPIFAGLFVVLLVLFLQYNRLIFAPIAAYVSPGEAPASEIFAVDPSVAVAVSPDPRLIIPKLNIDVPVHFGISVDDVNDAMNNGVAHYRINGASAFPGEIGNTVITGHSAGDIYSNNQYKFIFSGLERLEVGDLIYVNYNSTRYTYRMTRQEIIEPTNVSALIYDTDKPILTLITCTPLGTSKYRLLVIAEQISPTYNGQTMTTPEEPAEEKNLPANEPSFFEGIWNWITGQ